MIKTKEHTTKKEALSHLKFIEQHVDDAIVFTNGVIPFCWDFNDTDNWYRIKEILKEIEDYLKGKSKNANNQRKKRTPE